MSGAMTNNNKMEEETEIVVPKLELLNLPRGIPGINPVDRYKFLVETTPRKPCSEAPQPDVVTNCRPRFHTSRPETASYKDSFQSVQAKTFRPPSTARPASLTSSGRDRWIRLDRQVLRFFAYFKEAVHESPKEHFRVRKCTIMYYLASDEIQVTEPKVHNSGLLQGAFLHKIKANEFVNDKGEALRTKDLQVGKDMSIFGRTFHLFDCDAFTRSYYKQEHAFEQAAAEEYPIDPLAQKELSRKAEVEERCLQKAQRADKKQAAISQFLKFDRKVLRFIALWDDRKSEYGMLRKFTLTLYPADDTLELRECKKKYGENEFAQFVNRTKVEHPDVPGEHYRVHDFVLGKTIIVHKRPFLLVNCDNNTKDFFLNHYGIKQMKQPQAMPPEKPVRTPPPPVDVSDSNFCNGGSSSLIKKTYHEKYDGQVLKMKVALETELPQEKDRRFVVSYFLVNDTLAIFEPPQRNTGVIGGKFLERAKHINESTGELFKKDDVKAILLGQQDIQLLKRKFIFIQADNFTNQFFGIKNKKETDVHADNVLRRIVNQLLLKRIDIRATFRQFDTHKSNCLSIPKFKQLLEQADVVLDEEDLQLVVNHFAYDGQNVWYIDFCDILATKWAPLKEESSNRIDDLERQLLAKLRDTENRIRRLFRKFDKDNNGHLTFTEFQMMLKNYNLDLTPYEMAELMARYDTDKQGTIDYNEFCDKVYQCDFSGALDNKVVVVKKGQKINVEEYLSVLREEEEQIEALAKEDLVLKKFCKAFGQKRYKLRQTFREVDVSGDGKVSMDEFINACDHVCNLSDDEKYLLSKKFFPQPGITLDYETFMDTVFHKRR